MQNLPYSLIVFDWDGTLMDSAQQISTSIQHAAKALNLPVPTDEQARDVIGLGLPEAVDRLFPDAGKDVVAALSQGYRDSYSAKPPIAGFFAGAQSLLQDLSNQGYWLAVATGKSRRGLDRVLSASGLASLFMVTRCADEAFSKPHPQMLLDILDYTGVEPERALMVGDTEYDMQMAVSADVTAVGVACGVHSEARIMAAGAVTCLAQTANLQEWLLSK